ncbi:MAG: DNA mismatch repair endonuclease MutL [Candidatus Aminicenantes bacterium]|nr:DNA mismatch repair endonuclease MutL [Candidatus Aminicenantes bacterium]
MKKIILLPPDISQKIAAGEVIERPFSVVKELVENSLDANASEIKVELQSGGKKLVRVADNGHGMSQEDAKLCFERHSTSKIRSVEDLSLISTLGFRGEALPSISAVSRVVLKTSDGKDEKGTLIEKEGDKLIGTSDIAFPLGTSVEVRDLFFNLPAREKFLRSDRSELNLIVKFMTYISIAYPEVRFSLIHGKRQVFDYPPVSSLKERIYQVFGKSLLERLLEVDYEEDDRKLYGYSSLPPSGHRDRTLQLFYVNKRPVRDKTLLAALNQAYRGFLEKDTFPESFLFLTWPYPEVDINVHPAKAEVRFKDSRPVFQLVNRSIEHAILKEKGVKKIYPSKEEEIDLRMEEKRYFRIEEKRGAPAFMRAEERQLEWKDLFTPLEKRKETYPRVLGQYLDIYIVASSEEGILIVDQHNAHERVLFEKYEEIDKEKKWPQKLALLPIIFELSPSRLLSFENNQALLEEAGFRVEAMGGQSFALKEYPDIFKEEEAKDIFISLLEEKKGEQIEDKKKRLLATLACKTAVKAGEVLSFEKMNYLVEELFKTSNSSLCPHGRPIIVKIEKKEIERGLKRT